MLSFLYRFFHFSIHQSEALKPRNLSVSAKKRAFSLINALSMGICKLLCKIKQSYTALSTSWWLQIQFILVNDEVSWSGEKSFSFFFIHVEIVFFSTSGFSEGFLFAIPFSIWSTISHFSFKDLFVSFLFKVDVFLNYHWINRKFLEFCSFETMLKFFIWPMPVEFEFL